MNTLPQTLFESYDRLIRDMDADYRSLCLVALQWLVHADWSMTIDAVGLSSLAWPPISANNMQQAS